MIRDEEKIEGESERKKGGRISRPLTEYRVYMRVLTIHTINMVGRESPAREKTMINSDFYHPGLLILFNGINGRKL